MKLSLIIQLAGDEGIYLPERIVQFAEDKFNMKFSITEIEDYFYETDYAERIKQMENALFAGY